MYPHTFQSFLQKLPSLSRPLIYDDLQSVLFFYLSDLQYADLTRFTQKLRFASHLERIYYVILYQRMKLKLKPLFIDLNINIHIYIECGSRNIHPSISPRDTERTREFLQYSKERLPVICQLKTKYLLLVPYHVLSRGDSCVFSSLCLPLLTESLWY